MPILDKRPAPSGNDASDDTSAQFRSAHPREVLALLRELRDQMLSLRSQRVGALRELGSGAGEHPVAQMWAAFDAHSETLILVLDGFQRLGPVAWNQPSLRGLAARLSDRVMAMQQQLHPVATALIGCVLAPAEDAAAFRVQQALLHQLADAATPHDAGIELDQG